MLVFGEVIPVSGARKFGRQSPNLFTDIKLPNIRGALFSPSPSKDPLPSQ